MTHTKAAVKGSGTWQTLNGFWALLFSAAAVADCGIQLFIPSENLFASFNFSHQGRSCNYTDRSSATSYSVSIIWKQSSNNRISLFCVLSVLLSTASISADPHTGRGICTPRKQLDSALRYCLCSLARASSYQVLF